MEEFSGIKNYCSSSGLAETDEICLYRVAIFHDLDLFKNLTDLPFNADGQRREKSALCKLPPRS